MGFIVNYLALIGVACLFYRANGKLLDIALHAQVAPSGNQVVGSVITTDGLKAALGLRDDIAEVKVFYPFHYDGLTDTLWDVVIIEGWFPMIHDFLQIMRSIASHPTVLFYCLDPSYPGMNDILTYDVDGYLTNSRSLQRKLESAFPGKVEYVMLAADPEVMAPNTSIPRTNNALYLGAGGRMIEYKPDLLEMVRSAAPYGLTLHGMGWDEVDDVHIQAANKGVLPRYEIAQAYSSAVVVLASTIEAQRVEGMINNRVFEAMACGAVVLSDYSEALEEISEGVILFYRDGKDVGKWLQWTQENPQRALEMGQRSRDLVLSKHSWAHRAVSILGLVAEVASRNTVKMRCCDRPNCPTMLWVVASGLEDHIDYNAILSSHVYAGICRDYNVTIFSEGEFIESLHASSSTLGENVEKPFNQFESILLVLSPFDRLDVSVRKHFMQSGFRREVAKQHDKGYGRLQKWNALYLGVSAGARRAWGNDLYWNIFNEISSFAEANKQEGQEMTLLGAQIADMLRYDMYDLLLFRSKAEIDDFRAMFRIQTKDVTLSDDPCGHDAMRCELLFSFSEVIIQEASPGYRSPLAEQEEQEKGERDGQAPWSKDPESDQFKSEKTLEEERRTKVVDDKIRARRREPKPILVICFWQHAALCTLQNRRDLIGTDSVKDDDYRIFLLGGSFDGWLSLPDTLNYSFMHRVTHVGSRQKGIPAMALFAEVKQVFMMHGDEQSHLEPPCDLRRILSSLVTAGTSEEYCPTYDDTTLWPLALAAKSGAAISTWAANEILLSSAKTGLLDRLGGEHLTTMLQRSVCKAHGLGSGASRIAVNPVGLSHFLVAGVEYSEGLLNNVRSAEKARLEMDIRGEEKLEMMSAPVTDLLDIELSIVGDLSVIVRLDTANFVPGRDGDVCFQLLLPHIQRDRLNMTQSTNTMRYPMETEVNAPRACLLRLDSPFVLLNITLLYRQPPAVRDTDPQISLSQLATSLSGATLEVYARGNMFADTVDSVKTSLAPFLAREGRMALAESGVSAADVNVLDLEVLL